MGSGVYPLEMSPKSDHLSNERLLGRIRESTYASIGENGRAKKKKKCCTKPRLLVIFFISLILLGLLCGTLIIDK